MSSARCSRPRNRRESRLAICAVTKRVLATGLTLLGIEALERM